MGRSDYYEPGDWNITCARCGRKRKAISDGMRQLPPGVSGAGMWVCPEHWNVRQPQDFVRGIPDRMTPPFVQPPSDTTPSMCTANGLSAVPGFAEPGCFTPGYLSPAFNSSSDI